MAAPNIVNVAVITAKHQLSSLTTTAATSIISNASGSGKVLKVNNLVIANNSASTATVTVSVNDVAAGGGNAFQLIYQVGIAPNTSLAVIDKSVAIYLEEDKSLVATAGTASVLKINASYEELS